MATSTEKHKPRFAELCCKSNHSFLTGASHPEELYNQATEIGLEAIGFTDLNGVYGIPKAYRAQTQQKKAGAPKVPKLITGAEIVIKDKLNFRLLARDRAAYGALCRLLTAAHAGKEKGQAHLPWEEFLQHIQSPGCSGLIAIPAAEEPWKNQLTIDYGILRDIFRDRLLLPLSRFSDGWDEDRATNTIKLKQRYGIKIIATNEVHYHAPERRILHDVVTAIQSGTTVHKAGRTLFPNTERYLKSAIEMSKLFDDLPETLTNALEAAESCTFSPSELKYRYPSEWLPAGETAMSHLEKLVYLGARKRYPDGLPQEVIKQLKHELALIDQLSFADYFLTIWEIVEFARSRGILCQGRGSAANSAVCYCLEITAVDPVRMNLLFERFISAERGEPPDIDVDFEHERREEVIQHVYEKYGRDRAGMVATVITYRTRSSLRDVRKALGSDPDNPNPSLEPMATRVADELYGFPRHLGIHTGGFTLSADLLIETVPIEPARMENRTIVQWDKDDLDYIGLLKVDLLSLGMLSALQRTIQLAKLPSLTAIPPEDPKTYEMIRRADTVGVFQIESRAQMSMLPRLLPRNFYDLVVELALVRPGPIMGGMIHPYLRRRKGLEPVEVPDPRLLPILGKTLGIPIFQEQVMKMAVSLGGFTAGEADELRRAIGAWRSKGSIEKMGLRLMEGLRNNGLPEEYAKRVFDQIQGFASYGFPESHSASFALLAYASAYLKCHFPAEFACALLNSQPMGFYAPHTIVDDAKRHGVVIRPVEPNESEWDCTMEKTALRLGFRIMHGMSEADGRRIEYERTQGTFKDLNDFIRRTRLKSDLLHRLAMGGSFASFGLNQRQALWEILAYRIVSAESPAQPNLFASLPARKNGAVFQFTELDAFESMNADYASFGLSVRGHPMEILKKRLTKIPKTTTAAVKKLPAGASASVAGLVIARQRPETRSGVTFATLEDETGFLDLVLKKEFRERHEEIFIFNSFLLVQGSVQRDGMSVSMVVNKMKPLSLPSGEELPDTQGHDFR